MKQFLIALFFMLLTTVLLSQTFELEIEPRYLPDYFEIKLSRISKDTLVRSVIFSDSIYSEKVYIKIPYKKGDALCFRFFLNQKEKGMIQLYPNRLKMRKKQFLSVMVNEDLWYNFKTVKVPNDY